MLRLIFFLLESDCLQATLTWIRRATAVAVSLASLYLQRTAIVSCSRTNRGELHRFLLEMRLLLWQNLDHASPWLNCEAMS
jgi:hypothetical protein